MTFDELMGTRSWKAIRQCPGRFVLSPPAPHLAPQDLAGSDVELSEHQVPAARDTVIVGRFADGGLISYRRADGSFVHTLNTADGFERKLRQLGLIDQVRSAP